MTDAMDSEFGAVAAWTADAARELGADHHVPAGCRGSGGPAALDWLLHRLPGGSRLLDVGAGVGGPAGYARDRVGARSLLVEPQAAACRAARELFGFDVVQADAEQLPVPTAAFAAAWCVGVLCTTGDHRRVLRELARVLQPDGRVGVLAYVTTRPVADQPEGNHFPGRDELARLYADAGLCEDARTALGDLPGAPRNWTHRQDAVTRVIERDHGDDPAWIESRQQEQAIGELISSGAVAGVLSVLRPAGA